MIKYPVRCVIVDVSGAPLGGGIVACTPEVSIPHVGQRGMAHELEDGNVKIMLDNGQCLMGYECWWVEESVFDEVAKEMEEK